MKTWVLGLIVAVAAAPGVGLAKGNNNNTSRPPAHVSSGGHQTMGGGGRTTTFGGARGTTLGGGRTFGGASGGGRTFGGSTGRSFGSGGGSGRSFGSSASGRSFGAGGGSGSGRGFGGASGERRFGGSSTTTRSFADHAGSGERRFGGGEGGFHGAGAGHAAGHFMYKGRSMERFAAGGYHWRAGEHYRRWGRGYRFPREYWRHEYYVDDWADYGLDAPQDGYQWIRYGPDLLLVSLDTGMIVDAAYGVFADDGGPAPDDDGG